MKTNSRILWTLMPALLAGCQANSTVTASRKDIIETVYASGRIMADSEYTVYALNPGTVIRKRVHEGQAVKKGQVLLVINNTAPQARLEAARQSYLNARANLSPQSPVLRDLKLSLQNAAIKCSNDSLQYLRLKNLWAQNVGTRSALDNAEMQYRMAINEKRSAREKYDATLNDLGVSLKNMQSQVATAANDRNNFIIRAESDGTVFELMKEKGEAVRANEAVALLGKTTDRLIRLSVDQQDINLLQNGQQVLLKTDATGDKVFRAVVKRIYPTMNEADQTFRVDAAFTDRPVPSYIHTSVEANIIVRKKRQALVIPSAALLTGDSVRIKKDGKIRTVAVQTGIRTLDQVEVLRGLDEHEEVLMPSAGK